MKKFTALMLVVLMVVALVPFSASAATTWTKVDTAAEFAAMTDGNYWLTADIDLSKIDYETIAEFKGTLNGNGKTVTVPKDAPIFDKVTGTIQNLNVKGDVTLTGDDISATFVSGDIDGYPIGVLANVLVGATVENVHANVNVDFDLGTQPKKGETACGVSVGFIGYAVASFDLKTEGEGDAATKSVVLKKRATVKNVSVAGNWDLVFGNTDNRNNAGTIIGAANAGVDVSLAVSSAKVKLTDADGNKGGIIGHINCVIDKGFSGASGNYETRDGNVTITESLYNGTWEFVSTRKDDKDATKNLGERFGGIVGYGRGFNISKCANEGAASGNSTVVGLVGYGNSNGVGFANIVDSCICVGSKGCGTYTTIKQTADEKDANGTVTKDYTCEVTNIYRVENNTVNSGNGKDNGVMTYTDYADKAAARAAFAAAVTSFEVKDGVLNLKAIAFTPAADPADPAPAPTGDMTIALVAVAVVSLAAVTVIAKKKVND